MLPAKTPTPPPRLFLSPPPSPSSHSLSSLLFSHLLLRRPCSPALATLCLHRSNYCLVSLLPIDGKLASRTTCFAKPTAEDRLSDSETRGSDEVDYEEVENQNGRISQNSDNGAARGSASSASDLLSLGIPKPVYQVVEVKSNGMISTKEIDRRQLLKSSGLRPRDIRSVDPSLWLTNSMPSLLVREQCILLNLGSLRAIVMQDRVLIFNYNRRGGKAFIDSLLPRLSPENSNGGPSMPFVLEVVEAALLSRIQRLEQRMMELEPRVQSLLEVLPNRLTGVVLEQLRISKQTLLCFDHNVNKQSLSSESQRPLTNSINASLFVKVELGSRAGALRQMLLDLLEDTQEIRRICIIGRNCTLNRITNALECSVLIYFADQQFG